MAQTNSTDIHYYDIPTLFKLSREWSYTRSIHTLNLLGQFIKLNEEYKETACDGILEDNPSEVCDGLGDMAVVISVASTQLEQLVAEATNVDIRSLYFNVREFTEIEINDKITEAGATEELLRLSFNIHQFEKYAHQVMGKPEIYKPEDMKRIVEDFFLQLEVIASLLDSSLSICWSFAWNEIKDRKGRVINNIFVKEADLPKE